MRLLRRVCTHTDTDRHVQTVPVPLPRGGRPLFIAAGLSAFSVFSFLPPDMKLSGAPTLGPPRLSPRCAETMPGGGAAETTAGGGAAETTLGGRAANLARTADDAILLTGGRTPTPPGWIGNIFLVMELTSTRASLFLPARVFTTSSTTVSRTF